MLVCAKLTTTTMPQEAGKCLRLSRSGCAKLVQPLVMLVFVFFPAFRPAKMLVNPLENSNLFVLRPQTIYGMHGIKRTSSWISNRRSGALNTAFYSNAAECKRELCSKKLVPTGKFSLCPLWPQKLQSCSKKPFRARLDASATDA